MNHFASMQAGRSGISLETGGLGHAVLGWADDREMSGFFDIYSQRIDQDCNTLYSQPDEGGKIVSSIGSADLLTRHPRITYMNESTTVMVWEDYRNDDGSNSDVYLQLLDTNGDGILAEMELLYQQQITLNIFQELKLIIIMFMLFGRI